MNVSRGGWLWSLGIALMLPLSGCSLLEVPAPAKVAPTPVPPKVPEFVPAEGTKALLGDTPIEPLKLNSPGVPNGVDHFSVAQINVSSDGEPILLVQTRGLDKAGKPIVGNNSNPVRLAGILMPAPGKPGYDSALHTLQGWTLGQKLDMEQDPVIARDLAGRPRVQAYFVGRSGKFKDQKLNLNRLMVRSGYAVVDLHEPTTFDTRVWLKDEQLARETPAGLWQNPTFSMARRKPVKPPRAQGKPGGKPGQGPRGMKLNIQNAPGVKGAPGGKGAGAGGPNAQRGPGAGGGPNQRRRNRNRGNANSPQGTPTAAALSPAPPNP